MCTTLRPGLLSNPELCDGNVLASFVSNSIDYEPLEDQTKFNQYLVAPQTTLEWQRGDSADMACLLCSLLLGAGYNAYVVIGTADRRLTQNMTYKENIGEIPQILYLENQLLTHFSAEAALGNRRRPGLFQVQEKYCREFDDFKEVEKAFKEDQFVNQLKYKPSKEFEAFSFRPNTKELQCDLNSINVQEVE